MSRLAAAVAVALEAKKRIDFPTRPGVTFFSENDIWLYQAVMDTKVCVLCRIADEIGEFSGDQLRINFPFLEIIDETTIKANVHPNCRCYLTRYIEGSEA